MIKEYLVRLWNAIWKYKANVFCMMVAIILYFLNQFLFKNSFTGIVGYFCKCFFNDLVCPLFFLSYVQIVLIWAECEMKKYVTILMVGMSAGLVWEFFAPVINSNAVTDLYDLICYFSGIQIYYLIMVIEKKQMVSKNGAYFERI